MSTDSRGSLNQPVHQVVLVHEGYGWAVIGADLHVIEGRGPIYQLLNHTPTQRRWPDRIPTQPSYLLNARSALVDFTGRGQDVTALTDWLGGSPGMAVRWLHAPGGAGKTRLATHLADHAAASGWKVLAAVHLAEGIPPVPGSQDVRLGESAGLLMIVEYADRWPLQHLTWLLGNNILNQPEVSVRVLLVARSLDGWPELRAALTRSRVAPEAVSTQPLPPLPQNADARQEMFTAALSAFARAYQLDDLSVIKQPYDLQNNPSYGLTLPVHMAALAGVDAHHNRQQLPDNPVGHTRYLLDRERLYWTILYETGILPSTRSDLHDERIAFRTTPQDMGRAVFLAALTGPITRSAAIALCQNTGIPDPGVVINDHTRCYPPTNPNTVNEPIYPDRLAEDFLALTLDGSPISDYPVDAWATTATRRLLEAGTSSTAPAWNRRALTFLAAAAERWTHVGEGHLFPIVNASPQLAVEAGNAALASIASVKNIPSRILMAVEQVLPADRSLDLDSGALAVTDSLIRRMPMATEDMATRARHYQAYARRLGAVGRMGEAAQYAQLAVVIWRIAKEHASDYDARDMTEALLCYAAALCGLRRWSAMLDATQEAMEILEKLVDTNPSRHLPELATVMTNHAIALSGLGRREEALDYSKRTLDLFYTLVVKGGHTECGPKLARAAHNHANRLVEAGRQDEALSLLHFAVELREELVKVARSAHLADLAASVHAHAQLAVAARQPEAGLASGRRAVELLEEMAAADRNIHLPRLVGAMINYSIILEMAGRQAQAADYARRSVDLGEDFVASRPSADHIADLADHMSHLALWCEQTGRQPEALEYSQRAVKFCEHLTPDKTQYWPYLASHLRIFACVRARMGVDLDAASHAAGRATTLLAENAVALPWSLRNKVASDFGEMFTLLGRASDADQIRRRLLDESMDAELAAAQEKEKLAKWAKENPDWKSKVAEELQYILGFSWRQWPDGGADPPNRG